MKKTIAFATSFVVTCATLLLALSGCIHVTPEPVRPTVDPALVILREDIDEVVTTLFNCATYTGNHFECSSFYPQPNKLFTIKRFRMYTYEDRWAHHVPDPEVRGYSYDLAFISEANPYVEAAQSPWVDDAAMATDDARRSEWKATYEEYPQYALTIRLLQAPTPEFPQTRSFGGVEYPYILEDGGYTLLLAQEEATEEMLAYYLVAEFDAESPFDESIFADPLVQDIKSPFAVR